MVFLKPLPFPFSMQSSGRHRLGHGRLQECTPWFRGQGIVIVEFLVRFLAYRDLVSVITTIRSNSTLILCYKKQISVEALKRQFSKHRTPGKKNGGVFEHDSPFQKESHEKTSYVPVLSIILVGYGWLMTGSKKMACYNPHITGDPYFIPNKSSKQPGALFSLLR